VLVAVGWRLELWPHGATVLLGGRPAVLDTDEHRVWTAALGDPRHPADLPWTAHHVATTARLPRPEVDAVLRSLTERGLVVEVDPADPRPAARGLTLLPLAEGWGNTAQDPATFRYGLGGVELVSLPRLLHDGLSLAGRWPHLADAAAGLAAQAGTDALAELRRLLGALPLLCGLGVAAVQPAGAR
jgi:hypothetical protein